MLIDVPSAEPAGEIPQAASDVGQPTPILVSLSSFGAAEVRRHGQLWFARLAFDAGVDGVEVRSELLTDAEGELTAIAEVAREAGKSLVYSCADDLWNADGELDLRALGAAVASARLLHASRLKIAIGGFRSHSRSSLASLGDFLRDCLREGELELLIENDQTASAGTLAALQNFFSAARDENLSLGMTFDMGNWHWTGECALQAANALAPQVRYVHCKGVQRQPQRWVAVPLADSSAPWRAVLRALPASVPWAIEYPLAGDDLLAVAHSQVSYLRSVALGMASMADMKV